MKRLWIILIFVIAAVAAAYWWTHRGSSTDNSYQTDKVAHGDVQELIPATGTLEPVDSVDIGAQVAGQILYFGPDRRDPNFDADTKALESNIQKPANIPPIAGTDYQGLTSISSSSPTIIPANMVIDFRSEVKEGDLLAIIDPTIYQSALEQSQANLQSANANLEVAKANLESDKAKLTEAENDWNRAQALGPGEALAKTTYDGYQATYLTAKAQVDLGQAAITQANAAISEAQAGVDTSKRNLDYCTIKSPVNGTIIDRRVNIGQTVVSSLNTPSLFLIGTDMSKMQIWVSVNEADIPRIKEGMTVLFDVEGVSHEFQGTVGKVRWNATMTQNVVTYTVEVDADNPDGTLIPYRTANVKFLVKEQKNVLLVPNASLRWRPRDADMNAVAAAPAAAGTGAATGGTGAAAADTAGSGRGQRGRGTGSRGNNSATERPKQGTVYVLADEKPKAVSVQLGITDDVFTAVVGGDLKDGDDVVTGMLMADDTGGGTTNPFAPTILRGGRGGGGGGGGGRGGGGGG